MHALFLYSETQPTKEHLSEAIKSKKDSAEALSFAQPF